MRCLVTACAVTALSVLGCGQAPAPVVPSPASAPPDASAQTYPYAQRGQGCSPIDGYAVVFTFTQVDRGCEAKDGDDVLVVSYWGGKTVNAPHVVIKGPERGQVQRQRVARGAGERSSDADITLSKTGPSHIRATLDNGQVVDNDFVLRECPGQTQSCG